MSHTPLKARPPASKSPGRPKSDSPIVLGLVALFILPFVVIGLSSLLFGTGATLVNWARAQSWHATSATVESAAAVWEPHSRGGGGYRAEVTYRYEVGGTVYQGYRASFHRGPDKTFQKQLGDRLEEAQRTGTLVQVWVNPEEPAESVIDRSLRPGDVAINSIPGIGFTGLGLGFWWVLLLGWRMQRSEAKETPSQSTPSDAWAEKTLPRHAEKAPHNR